MNWHEISEKYRLEGALYKKAQASMRLGDVSNCLDYITRYFYLRNQRELNLHSQIFFRIQFSTYLLGRENFKISNMEGDMIAVFIMDSFDDIEEELKECPLSVDEHFISWCTTVELDFPFNYDFGNDG